MSFSPYTTLFLTEQDRMQDLFRAFRANSARDEMNGVIYGLLILAGIVAVMLIFSMLINFRRRRRGYTNPLGLFLNLCRAHKLRWSERWLLWRLARLQQMTEPARLFLEPHWFNPAHLPAVLQEQAFQLKAIRDRLFAELKKSIKSIDDGRSVSAEPIQPQGAALPGLKTAPDLDIPPWSATGFSQPWPPMTNSSDGTPV